MSESNIIRLLTVLKITRYSHCKAKLHKILYNNVVTISSGSDMASEIPEKSSFLPPQFVQCYITNMTPLITFLHNFMMTTAGYHKNAKQAKNKTLQL